MNDKLQSKREQLVSQRDQLQQAIQKLEAERMQMIANVNAHNGAILVIDDLLKEATPDASNPA